MVTIWPSDGNGVGCKSQPSGRRARFFLLAAAGQQSPDLVVTAHVAGLGLVDIASEDLAYFVNVYVYYHSKLEWIFLTFNFF